MFHWYLLVALLMSDDTAATTTAIPYATRTECEAMGVKRATEVLKDTKVKDVLWTCVSVNFDPVPQRPPPLDKKQDL